MDAYFRSVSGFEPIPENKVLTSHFAVNPHLPSNNGGNLATHSNTHGSNSARPIILPVSPNQAFVGCYRNIQYLERTVKHSNSFSTENTSVQEENQNVSLQDLPSTPSQDIETSDPANSWLNTKIGNLATESVHSNRRGAFNTVNRSGQSNYSNTETSNSSQNRKIIKDDVFVSQNSDSDRSLDDHSNENQTLSVQCKENPVINNGNDSDSNTASAHLNMQMQLDTNSNMNPTKLPETIRCSQNGDATDKEISAATSKHLDVCGAGKGGKGMTTVVHPPTPVAEMEELELLAKLEEANRELENDHKARLTPPKKVNAGHRGQGHSRQASISSVASNMSQCSTASGMDFEPANAEELWNVWSKIVSDWDNVYRKKTSYVKELVAKGVPAPFRGIVWQLLCHAHQSDAKTRYAEYLKYPSAVEKSIRRDITRTYPEHDFFKEKNGLGQESLFNVMKAYSIHDREVGYCQGSGFIVGLLLMQMPEEEAFAVLVTLMEDFHMRELFKPSMAELGVCMFQLESLIQDLLPDLYAHLQAQNLSVTMFASSWFLTLFTTSLPLQTACRVFDIFLVQGTEFVFRVALSILQLCVEQLLALDMEGFLKFFQKENLVTVLEPQQEQLIQTALNLKISAKRLKKLEKEYNNMKTKETEEQVEIRRLRTENKLLRQRVDNLEKETATLADRLIHEQLRCARQDEQIMAQETATLADRLIHEQLRCAQQDEQIMGLKKDLSLVRTERSEVNTRLDEVTEQYENLCRSNSSSSSQASIEASCAESASDNTRALARLQAEVAELKAKDAVQTATIRQLKHKLGEAENRAVETNKPPSEELQTMQEELIACKLREAEANLSMKELQQKVTELKHHWIKNMERLSACNPLSKASKTEVRVITDEIMSVRVREAQLLAELKDSKQRLMELETQCHIVKRQVSRLEEENQRLQDELEKSGGECDKLRDSLLDYQRKADAYDSQQQEDAVMRRLRGAEHAHTVAELRQRIAELEIKTQEYETAGQLRDTSGSGDLTNRIAELQDQVLQLKMGKGIGNVSDIMHDLQLDSGPDEDSDLEDDLEVTMQADPDTLTSVQQSARELSRSDSNLLKNETETESSNNESETTVTDKNETKTLESGQTVVTRPCDLHKNKSNTAYQSDTRDHSQMALLDSHLANLSGKQTVDCDKTPTQESMDLSLLVNKTGSEKRRTSDVS